MVKRIVVATLVILGMGEGAAVAQNRTLPSWMNGYDVTPFETKSVSIAVATNKKTNKRMQIVKLKDGRMMALVPAEGYMMMMSGEGEGMVE